MGCSSSSKAAAHIPGLVYDNTGAPISCGADKYVFQGTHNGRKVAVIVARRGGEKRIQHEIDLFSTIGKHPNIIEMFATGADDLGMPLAALEAVEPIGYDMSRLVNQYSWTGQVVPEKLMCSLTRQLIGALQHMHKVQLVHQDLKVQNVLVTPSNDLKLIDMGITVKIGERGKLRAAYLAPEVCMYETITEKVDCWGVGLILHQVYQKRATLLKIASNIEMKRGMPSKAHPMAAGVRETMCGLLTFNPKDRWSLQDTLDSSWFKEADKLEAGHILAPASSSAQPDTRRFLGKYVGPSGSFGAVTAYAARIGSSQKHIIDKTLNDLDFSKNFGITVVLTSSKDGRFERNPGKDTKIEHGTWIYFGIRDSGQDEDEAAEALTAICQTLYGKKYDPAEKVHDIADAGSLVELTMDCDCFTFPDRKDGSEYVIGRYAKFGQCALDLRRTMNINLAGIVTKDRGTEWYPQAGSTVKPGDIGLIVRAPNTNGMSEPTVHDADLEALMDVSRPLPSRAGVDRM